MLQNWMVVYEFVRTRQSELLEQARRERAVQEARREARRPKIRPPRIELCETCPLRAPAPSAMEVPPAC
jgi:hypothetical protein